MKYLNRCWKTKICLYSNHKQGRFDLLSWLTPDCKVVCFLGICPLMILVVELVSKFVFVCLGTSIKSEVTGCLESILCPHSSLWAAANVDRRFKPLRPAEAPPGQDSKGFQREAASKLALSRSVLFLCADPSLPNVTSTFSKCSSFRPWGIYSPVFLPICSAAF